MAPLASWLLPLMLVESSLAYVSYPIHQSRSRHRIARRQDDEAPLYNITQVSYLIELDIGTPAQTVRVAVDTGSSELWVNPECSTAQSPTQIPECRADGQYDPDDSSSSTDMDSQSKIPYGIGTVYIEYYSDTVALANTSITLDGVQFGVATHSKDLSEGIMGLSFGNMTGHKDLTYANIIDQLYLQNVTQSRAFSVALGNQDQSNAGVLSFGGLDTGKFSGDLQTLPILGPQYGENLWRYWVQQSSISSSTNGTDRTYDNSTFPVVLDSGSSLCTLPTNIIEDMITDMNGYYDPQSGEVAVYCSEGDNADNALHFAFGNSSTAQFTIDVPYSAFLIPASGPWCILGAVPGDSLAILGDTFMRSAYTVFDQDNMEVSMAPYGGDCGDSEQDIPSGGVSSMGTVTGSCDSNSNSGGNNSGGNNSGGDGDNTGAAIKLSSISASFWGLMVLVGLQAILF